MTPFHNYIKAQQRESRRMDWDKFIAADGREQRAMLQKWQMAYTADGSSDHVPPVDFERAISLLKPINKIQTWEIEDDEPSALLGETGAGYTTTDYGL